MSKINIPIKVPVIFHEDYICVYRVWFGDFFYIGSTMNLPHRMICLSKTISDCFDGKRVGENSQTAIMNHLIDHPNIVEGIAEVLEFVESEYDLVFAEWRWLNKYYNDFNCLNQTDKTSRKINGIIIRPHDKKVQIRHNPGKRD